MIYSESFIFDQVSFIRHAEEGIAILPFMTDTEKEFMDYVKSVDNFFIGREDLVYKAYNICGDWNEFERLLVLLCSEIYRRNISIVYVQDKSAYNPWFKRGGIKAYDRLEIPSFKEQAYKISEFYTNAELLKGQAYYEAGFLSNNLQEFSDAYDALKQVIYNRGLESNIELSDKKYILSGFYNEDGKKIEDPKPIEFKYNFETASSIPIAWKEPLKDVLIPHEYYLDILNHTRYYKKDIDDHILEFLVYPGRIWPAKQFINIDTKEESLTVFIEKDDEFTPYTMPLKDWDSNNCVNQLAKYGFYLSSEFAGPVSAYIMKSAKEYRDILSRAYVSSRIGWVSTDFSDNFNGEKYEYIPRSTYKTEDDLICGIQNYFEKKNNPVLEHHFVPFIGNVRYNESDSPFKNEFQSISEQKGTLDGWINLIKPYRNESHKELRMVLAASFASVLIRPMHALPFIVHVWGTTGTGKSVALMLAASIWASPELSGDRYIKSFNATDIGLETKAQFYGDLPFCIDELQTQQDRKSFNTLIYNLTEGSPRTRYKVKQTDVTKNTWSNTIITTGEQPINDPYSQGGSLNRVLDIHLSGPLFTDDVNEINTFCGELQKNYNHAGRIFLKRLCTKANIKRAQDLFNDYRNRLIPYASGKQAISAAILLTADTLAAEWIFKDELILTIEDMIPYVKDEKTVDSMEELHTRIKEWIAAHPHAFDENASNRYGRYVTGNSTTGSYYAFIPTQLDEIMKDIHGKRTSYIAWAKEHDKLIYTNGRNRMSVLIDGKNVWCYCITFD